MENGKICDWIGWAKIVIIPDGISRIFQVKESVANFRTTEPLAVPD